MKLVAVLSCLMLVLGGCGGGTVTPATEPSAPTQAVETQAAPTQAVETQAAPTKAPAVKATPLPATPAPAEAPTETPTHTPTTAARPRPTATSSGPLDFQPYVANCKRAPTAEKPANVIIQIAIEATGGNGVYRYFYQGAEEPDKFIEIPWEQGKHLVYEVKVTSGDGQTLTKGLDLDTKPLVCP